LSVDRLALLDEIVLEVAGAEAPISVRGIAYRVLTHPANVEAGVIAKSEADFRKVQRAVLKLRRSGRMPYEWIADGTRWTIRPTTHADADAALADLSASYRRDLWTRQDHRVEVWTEKDAMAGVLTPVTDRWQVGLFVSRGFASETFLHSSAMAARADGRPTVLLQVGDHDASGVRAWEDIQRKLAGFAPDVDWHFRRLAVTPEQVDDLGLPTRPQKATSHAAGWTGGAVEVDAMPTDYLRTLLEEAITERVDRHVLASELRVQESERYWLANLTEVAE
jgi:hypothetical protein